MIEGSLRDFLLSDDAIAAVVGTRIYPEFAPTNESMALIVLQTVSEFRQYDLQESDGAYRESRHQIDCYANFSSEAGALAELVDARMKEYFGVDANHNVEIQMAENAGREQTSERDGDRIDRRVSLDYIIVYTVLPTN